MAPTPQGAQTICDRLTEVGITGSPLSAIRITVRTESGALSAAVIAQVAYDGNGQGYWSDLSLSLDKDAPAEVTARVNRLLNGYAIERPGTVSMTLTRRNAPPKVGKHWRTSKISMFHAGRIIPTPAVCVAKPHILPGGTLTTMWSVSGHSMLRIEPNTAQGFAPVAPATPVRPKRATRQSRTATATPSVTPVTPSQTPSGSATVMQSAHPKPKASVLPVDHPGIFHELAAPPYTVLTSPEVARKLAAAYKRFETTGKTTVVCFRGPSGAGKTLHAINFAVTNGLPFVKFEVQGLRDFSDWFGSVSLKETPSGKVVSDYQPSDFAEAVRLDGPYSGIPRLVLLDELTRAETSASLNALMAVLDSHGTVYIPDARKSISIDPAVIFFATANIGAGFTGTVVTDTALNNRVTAWVPIEYLDAAAEAKVVAEQAGTTLEVAKQLVSVAAQLRSMASRGELPTGVSTRQLVRIGEHIVAGLTPVESYEVGFADDAQLSREGGAASDYTKAMNTVNAVLR